MAVLAGQLTDASPSVGRSPASDSAARILECAIDVIESNGEAALRVAEIGKKAGIAVPSVYHWFGSREGLIIAAHRERFRRNLSEILVPYQRALEESNDAEEFRTATLAALELAFGPARRTARTIRLNVFGSAVSRPELLEVVVEQQSSVIRQAGAFVAEAQSRGWVRREYDAATLAAYLMCEVFGQVVIEIGESSLTSARWADLSRQTQSHVLFGTPVVHHGPYPIDDLTVAVCSKPSRTGQRILDWAVEQIDAQGEAPLRMADLVDLGISLTSIYHHFGSRDGLVQAAQVERFTATQDMHVAQLETAVSACSSAAEFAAVVQELCADLFSETRAVNRLRRVSVLGSLHGRPELASDIARRQNELCGRAAHLVEHARRQGWIAPESDSLAFAAWAIGLGLSRSLIELVESGVDGAEWNRIATDAVTAAAGL